MIGKDRQGAMFVDFENVKNAIARTAGPALQVPMRRLVPLAEAAAGVSMGAKRAYFSPGAPPKLVAAVARDKIMPVQSVVKGGDDVRLAEDLRTLRVGGQRPVVAVVFSEDTDFAPTFEAVAREGVDIVVMVTPGSISPRLTTLAAAGVIRLEFWDPVAEGWVDQRRIGTSDEGEG